MRVTSVKHNIVIFAYIWIIYLDGFIYIYRYYLQPIFLILIDNRDFSNKSNFTVFKSNFHIVDRTSEASRKNLKLG